MIFARNPEKGKVKTRLAKGVGPEKALEIYFRLLEHTRDQVIPLGCSARVYYSDYVENGDLWPDDQFEKKKQEGDDLGTRMYKAFADAFYEGYRKVIIIGTDLYELQTHHLREAFDALENHNAVIGPAKDGGFYLLGLKEMIPEIFDHKPWGTDQVLELVRADIEKTGLKPYLLEELNDIDTLNDLRESELSKEVLDQ